MFDEQGTGFQKETPNQGLSPEKSSDRKAIINPEAEPVEIDCGGDLTEETPEGEENPDGMEHLASVPRPTRIPDWFGDRVVYLVADVSEEPTTLKEALTAPEAGEWRRGWRMEESYGEGAGVTQVK